MPSNPPRTTCPACMNSSAGEFPGQGIYNTPSADPVPMTPWAQAKYDAAKPGYGPKASVDTTDPILRCNPSGIPRILFWPQPFEVVQTPDRVFMFFEHERVWRQIWTDGRSHPKDVEPTWMGDSIGKWEGDTFVVDTIGLNDKSWLDAYGHPHSEELHLVERYRRPEPNRLTLQFTVEDPKAYTTVWESDTKNLHVAPERESGHGRTLLHTGRRGSLYEED